MADIGRAIALMGLFDELYAKKHGKPPKGNSHKEKWGFADMIDDLGYRSSVEVIQYYFKTNPRSGHSRQHLAYHYEEYEQAISDKKRDRNLKHSVLQRMHQQYES